MVNLCVTTFNRQDMLAAMLRSAFAGTVRPDTVTLIDQVNRRDLLEPALSEIPVPYEVIDLGDKRGCEGSAINFYLERVGQERVIAHEDLTFGPRSLEQFLATAGDFVIDASMGVITYRDRCRELIGVYDCSISPNSFRYVDVDYEDRLAMVGIHPTVVDCGIWHLQNGTMKGYSPEAIATYFTLESRAEQNYLKKWGRPLTHGGNTINRGEWRRANYVNGHDPNWGGVEPPVKHLEEMVIA